MAPRRTRTRSARRGLLRGWVSEPRPPNHHPSCANPARYVRTRPGLSKSRSRRPTPSCSRSPTTSRALTSRERRLCRLEDLAAALARDLGDRGDLGVDSAGAASTRPGRRRLGRGAPGARRRRRRPGTRVAGRPRSRRRSRRRVERHRRSQRWWPPLLCGPVLLQHLHREDANARMEGNRPRRDSVYSAHSRRGLRGKLRTQVSQARRSWSRDGPAHAGFRQGHAGSGHNGAGQEHAGGGSPALGDERQRGGHLERRRDTPGGRRRRDRLERVGDAGGSS
jgi:hypothetical protein